MTVTLDADNPQFFCQRLSPDSSRHGDERDPFMRDKSRIIHSAAFRRLQGKTQVMGPGEGDFHRTRLTHSIESGQIGEGILKFLKEKNENEDLTYWLPSSDLVVAACYAHDIGHPPYGHSGERALHRAMRTCGGFEGNAQTIRILTKLEKYKRGIGINPTRRTILSVLKYPKAFSEEDASKFKDKPPKRYYQEENDVIQWAISGFSDIEQQKYQILNEHGKPKYMTLDASIMECADDIAYGVHDLEDIVARGLVSKDELLEKIREFFVRKDIVRVGEGNAAVHRDEFENLFESSFERKDLIGKLVNLFVTSTRVVDNKTFTHPLLRYNVEMPTHLKEFQEFLKEDVTYQMVVNRAETQTLERKGQMLITSLYDAFIDSPKNLIPKSSFEDLSQSDNISRVVCDYIAGMTDNFAEKYYHRLFTVGYGSSSDEL